MNDFNLFVLLLTFLMGIFHRAQTSQKLSQRYPRMTRCCATCRGYTLRFYFLSLVPHIVTMFFFSDCNFRLLRGTFMWSDFPFTAVVQRVILTGVCSFWLIEVKEKPVMVSMCKLKSPTKRFAIF